MKLRTREDVALLFSEASADIKSATLLRVSFLRVAAIGAAQKRDTAAYRREAEKLALLVHDCLPGVPGRDEAIVAVWLAAHRYDARDFAGAQSRLGDAREYVEYAIRDLAAERS